MLPLTTYFVWAAMEEAFYRYGGSFSTRHSAAYISPSRARGTPLSYRDIGQKTADGGEEMRIPLTRSRVSNRLREWQRCATYIPTLCCPSNVLPLAALHIISDAWNMLHSLRYRLPGVSERDASMGITLVQSSSVPYIFPRSV